MRALALGVLLALAMPAGTEEVRKSINRLEENCIDGFKGSLEMVEERQRFMRRWQSDYNLADKVFKGCMMTYGDETLADAYMEGVVITMRVCGEAVEDAEKQWRAEAGARQ